MIDRPHIDFREIPESEMIYPLTYYHGDYEWILSQLRRLKTELRKGISDEYERLWKSSGHDRKVVNTFLSDYVKEHGSTPTVTARANMEYELSGEMQDRVNKLRSSTGGRKTILDMVDGK